MRILCITDPLTHPPTDTTVALYNRLADDARFELFHVEATRLGDALPVSRIGGSLSFAEFQSLGRRPVEPAAFADFDLVLGRTDKPFPPGYLDCLVRHENDTRFVARPSSIWPFDNREFTRLVAGEFMPPGIITRDAQEAASFVRAHGSVVAKQNRSYGGKRVFRIQPGAGHWSLDRGDVKRTEFPSLDHLLAGIFSTDSEPFEFVRFLARVTVGDKRVLTVEQEIYGALLRKAPSGGWVNNLSSGGTPHPAEVTPREREIVQKTCGIYSERGIHTIGYDFLMGDAGEWVLSEINPGSNIVGYDAIERLTGMPVMRRFLDWLYDFGTR